MIRLAVVIRRRWAVTFQTGVAAFPAELSDREKKMPESGIVSDAWRFRSGGNKCPDYQPIRF